jgi:regulatory protein
MKITALTPQVKSPHRVNVFVDDQYMLSLDIAQIPDLGVKVGREISLADLDRLRDASVFGKLYTQALAYLAVRPRSEKEICTYLARKNAPSDLIARIVARLKSKNHLDDAAFADFYIANRFRKKGISAARLIAELRAKGVGADLIADAQARQDRSDSAEICKIIAKKRAKYGDRQLIAYLVRQGFAYDLAQSSVREMGSQN